MKDFTTAAKVGFVVVLSVVATLWMFAQVGQNLTNDADSFRVYAMLDDVSGLVTKSRVSIAGINVGQLDEVELVDGRARVWIRISKRQDFILRSDAAIHKRQASLLGEYYLEITPGYLGDPLSDGDQIKNVGSDVSPAELMNDLRKISKDVVAITQSVKRVVGADGGEQKLIEIIDEFRTTAGAIQQMVSRNSQKFDVIVDNVVATTESTRGFSEEFRADSRLILDDTRAITSNVRSIIGTHSGSVEEGFEGMKGAIARLQSALIKLEATLDSTKSIGQKIDEGDGTLGQLVNDGSLARNLNELLEESNIVVRQFTRLQTVVGMSSEMYADRGSFRNAMELRLQPRPDKYYTLELIDDPRGRTSFTETVTNTSSSLSDPLVREQRAVTEDRFRLSLQFAKRFSLVTGRLGIIENSGGIGFDVHLFGDDLELASDIFAFQDNVKPRVRFRSRFSLFSHVYMSAGVDEVANRELTDYFFGLGLRFTDEDLKTILFVSGAPSL